MVKAGARQPISPEPPRPRAPAAVLRASWQRLPEEMPAFHDCQGCDPRVLWWMLPSFWGHVGPGHTQPQSQGMPKDHGETGAVPGRCPLAARLRR